LACRKTIVGDYLPQLRRAHPATAEAVILFRMRRGHMKSGTEIDAEFVWATVVPELLITDLQKSLWFWRDLCGFSVVFDRPEEGFAYLDRDGAQIMLDQRGLTRDWETGPMEIPYGRGVNFQVRVTSLEPILAALAGANWPLFLEPEEKWYRTGAIETGVRQFLVQDPDGYLLRFSAWLGERAISAPDGL
jgi:catechol 2,3-dioxygenase-like lactoylglutathione lyase family enzyme